MAQEKEDTKPLFKIQIHFLQTKNDLQQHLPPSFLGSTKLLLIDVRDFFEGENVCSEADFLTWLQQEVPNLVIHGNEKTHHYLLQNGTLILKQTPEVLQQVQTCLVDLRRQYLKSLEIEGKILNWETLLQKKVMQVRKLFTKKLQTDFIRFLQTEKQQLIRTYCISIFEHQKFEITNLKQLSYIGDFDITIEQDRTIVDPKIEILNLGWTLSGKFAIKENTQLHLMEFCMTYCGLEEPIKKIKTQVGTLEIPSFINFEITQDQTFFSEEILLIGPILQAKEDSLDPMWIVIEVTYHTFEETK